MSIPVTSLIKFLFIFLGILLLIFILALLTPKIAAKVYKIAAKLIKSKSEKYDDGPYKVKSIYDLPEQEKNNDTGEMENGEK